LREEGLGVEGAFILGVDRDVLTYPPIGADRLLDAERDGMELDSRLAATLDGTGVAVLAMRESLFIPCGVTVVAPLMALLLLVIDAFDTARGLIPLVDPTSDERRETRVGVSDGTDNPRDAITTDLHGSAKLIEKRLVAQDVPGPVRTKYRKCLSLC